MGTIKQSTDIRTRHHHSVKPTGSLIWSLNQPDSFVGFGKDVKDKDVEEGDDGDRDKEGKVKREGNKKRRTRS